MRYRGTIESAKLNNFIAIATSQIEELTARIVVVRNTHATLLDTLISKQTQLATMTRQNQESR